MIYMGEEIDVLDKVIDRCIDKLFDYEKNCEEANELSRQISDIEKVILISKVDKTIMNYIRWKFSHLFFEEKF